MVHMLFSFPNNSMHIFVSGYTRVSFWIKSTLCPFPYPRQWASCWYVEKLGIGIFLIHSYISNSTSLLQSKLCVAYLYRYHLNILASASLAYRAKLSVCYQSPINISLNIIFPRCHPVIWSPQPIGWNMISSLAQDIRRHKITDNDYHRCSWQSAPKV